MRSCTVSDTALFVSLTWPPVTLDGVYYPEQEKILDLIHECCRRTSPYTLGIVRNLATRKGVYTLSGFRGTSNTPSWIWILRNPAGRLWRITNEFAFESDVEVSLVQFRRVAALKFHHGGLQSFGFREEVHVFHDGSQFRFKRVRHDLDPTSAGEDPLRGRTGQVTSGPLLLSAFPVPSDVK